MTHHVGHRQGTVLDLRKLEDFLARTLLAVRRPVR